jgi:RimJ/RimL family protein N-acetyltransferase
MRTGRSVEIRYLIALIEPGNVRSIAVAKRLGMTPLRTDAFLDRSMIVHSVDRDKWLRQQLARPTDTPVR